MQNAFLSVPYAKRLRRATNNSVLRGYSGLTRSELCGKAFS